MSQIIPIKGLCKFTIILDPSVWIFDHRKILLDPFLQNGARITVNERETSGSYGIPLGHFLGNAEPLANATDVICHQAEGKSTKISLEDAMESIIGFAHEGKPLREDGPLHLYINTEDSPPTPITHITLFEIVGS